MRRVVLSRTSNLNWNCWTRDETPNLTRTSPITLRLCPSTISLYLNPNFQGLALLECAFCALPDQVSKARVVFRELLDSPMDSCHSGHRPHLLSDNASSFTKNISLITASQISLHTPSLTKARYTRPANTSSSLSRSEFFIYLKQ